MKIQSRLKNAGFWVSLLSAVFLILGAFGVEIAGETADAVINAVCSLLVVFGIVSDPTTGKGYLDGVIPLDIDDLQESDTAVESEEANDGDAR